MKSILFLIPSLGGGGAERVLVNLVNNLDKSKFDITLQTLFDVGVNRQFLNPEIKYVAGFPYMFRGNTHLMKLLSPRLLYKLLVKKQYDIVVSYMEGPTARIVSGCPYTGTKKISWIHVEQHTLERFSGSFRSVEEAKKCYRLFDKTICVARTVKEDFEKFVDVNCEVLYNINEDQHVKMLGQEPIEDCHFSKDINLVSVAKLEEAKGYDRLVKVHKQLLQEGIRNQVYLIGCGSQENMLKQLVQDLGVQDTFHFLGFKVNPYKYVSKADVYICSSRREGFSTAVTEAMFLGLPIVSTCCSGAKELLGENNEYGIVTENSEQGIYSGLKEMLFSSETIKRYKDVALCRAEKFSKEKTKDKITVMLESLFN